VQGHVELMVFTSRDLNLRWVAFVALGRGSEHCEEEEIGQQGSGDEQVSTYLGLPQRNTHRRARPTECECHPAPFASQLHHVPQAMAAS